MQRRLLLVLGLVSVASACAPRGPQLSRFGLTDDRYALRVAFERPGVFVSDDWLVENLVRVTPGTAELKRGPAYEARYRLDLDNDGRSELYREHAYVLKLRHRRNIGVLWSAVVPLPTSLESTELRVLARLLVDAASRDTVTLSVVDRSLEVDSRRLATRTLSEGPEAVRGYEGYRVVFEVADVDQQSVAPNTSWERREVLLVRPGFVWLAHGRVPAPAVLMLGHANLPDDFESTRPDFQRFVDAVDFREDELQAARGVIRGCTAGHELASVAVVSESFPVLAVGVGLSEDELNCIADGYPAGAPAISMGVRREPFVVPASPEVPSETVPSETVPNENADGNDASQPSENAASEPSETAPAAPHEPGSPEAGHE